jgi:hypothetical protein
MSLKLLAKYLLLLAIYFVVDMVSGMVLPAPIAWTPSPEQVSGLFGGLLLVAAVNTLVISLIVARSTWSGWRLFAAVAFSWYGVMTLMAQIEAYWFGPALRLARSVPLLLALNALPLVLIVSLAAVVIWGKAARMRATPPLPESVPHTAAEWLWKLGVIAIAYLILYFGFGYVVAWQNPALRAMYDNGADPIVFNYAYLIPLQIGRSALWVLFALPVIWMARGSRWETALLVGLLLALPMNIGHVLPNPIMPDPSVRLSHFIETTSSNFLFGMFITWLLSWRHVHLAMHHGAPMAR